MTIEFILSEINSTNVINKKNILRYFSDAQISVYTEKDLPDVFDKHPRWGYRMHDFYQPHKLLESKADLAIAIDADMLMVSDRVKAIVPLARAFGFCVPASSRRLVEKDTRIGADSDKKLDDSLGAGYTMCPAFMAFWTADPQARKMLLAVRGLMFENPLRLPLVLWRAAYMTGVAPYILPQNWCVCEDDLGIGDEIILHTGHKKVRDFYHVQ